MNKLIKLHLSRAQAGLLPGLCLAPGGQRAVESHHLGSQMRVQRNKEKLVSLFFFFFCPFLPLLFIVLRMERLLLLHLQELKYFFLFFSSLADQFCSLSTVCPFGCLLVSYLLGSQSCQLCCSPCICHPLWNILCCLLLWVVSI